MTDDITITIINKPRPAQKFKVWVLAAGESTYATNGVEHDSEEDAISAAENLFMRWFAANDWAVLLVGPTGYLSADEIGAKHVARR